MGVTPGDIFNSRQEDQLQSDEDFKLYKEAQQREFNLK
jgi:hypothetical protein